MTFKRGRSILKTSAGEPTDPRDTINGDHTMRPIIYAVLTLATLHTIGVNVDTVLGACAVIFAALATGTAYMNRDELARSATRYAFRAARKLERGTPARRFGFRAARMLEAYAARAERQMRADGLI